MKINRDEIVRVAQLAHLELSAEEIEKFEAQLDSILTYIEKLNELDVNSVDPMSQVVFASDKTDTHPELREDILLKCDVADAVLSSAPGAEKPFFRVPKVIER